MSEMFEKDTGLSLNQVKVFQDDYGLYFRNWTKDGVSRKTYLLNSGFTFDRVVSDLRQLDDYYQNSKKTPQEKLIETVEKFLSPTSSVYRGDLEHAFAEYKAAEAKKKEF